MSVHNTVSFITCSSLFTREYTWPLRLLGQRSTRTHVVRLPAISSGEDDRDPRDIVPGEPGIGEWLTRTFTEFDGSVELALCKHGCTVVSTMQSWLFGGPESGRSLWL